MTDKSAAAVREFAEKWGFSQDKTNEGFLIDNDRTKQCLSDLTALISEHYVAKEEVDKMVSERNEKSPCDTLYDYIVTDQSIECDICEYETEVFDIDLNAACDHFYGEGWRIYDGTKHCPKCADRHMNNLNSISHD